VTKLELLTVLYSLDSLHEEGKPDTAHKVIKRIIAEAETGKNQSKDKTE